MAIASMSTLLLLVGTAAAMLHRHRNSLWNALAGRAPA